MTHLAMTRDDIYQWNNDGIFHLETKRLDEAIYCFRMALSLAKAQVIHARQMLSMSTFMNPSKPEKIARRPFVPRETSKEENSMSSSLLLTEDRTGDLPKFLYMQPRRLHPEVLYPQITSFCVTFLFNLTVAMHLKAVSIGSDAGSNQKERLATIVSLYEHIYTHLLTHGGAGTGFNSRDDDLLLAALNNMAVVQTQLEMHNTARRCFENLLSSIMCMKTSGVCRSQRSDPFLLEGIFRNIVDSLGLLTEPIYAPGA